MSKKQIETFEERWRTRHLRALDAAHRILLATLSNERHMSLDNEICILRQTFMRRRCDAKTWMRVGMRSPSIAGFMYLTGPVRRDNYFCGKI